MARIILFLAGLFLANGVPHFVNGISGRDFHNPFLHRFVPSVPSPLFNVIWGILSFSLAIALHRRSEVPAAGTLSDYGPATLGLCFAALGLSIFFARARNEPDRGNQS